MNTLLASFINAISYGYYLADCMDCGIGALTYEQWAEALSNIRQMAAAARRSA